MPLSALPVGAASALAEAVECRVRVGWEVRQLPSNLSCSCVALDTVLNPSGERFPHPPNGGGDCSCLAGVVRIK